MAEAEEQKQETNQFAQGNYFYFQVKYENHEFYEDGGCPLPPHIHKDADLMLQFAKTVQLWSGRLPSIIGMINEQTKFFGVLRFDGTKIRSKFQTLEFAIGQHDKFKINLESCPAKKGLLKTYNEENLGVQWWQKTADSKAYTQEITEKSLVNINELLDKAKTANELHDTIIRSGNPYLFSNIQNIQKSKTYNLLNAEPIREFTAADYKLSPAFIPNLRGYQREVKELKEDLASRCLDDWEQILRELYPDYAHGTLYGHLVTLEELEVNQQLCETDENIERIKCLLDRFIADAKKLKGGGGTVVQEKELPESFFHLQPELTQIRHLLHEIECYEEFRRWFDEELVGKFGTRKRRKPVVIVGPRAIGKSVFSKLVVGWSESRLAQIEEARQHWISLRQQLDTDPYNTHLKDLYEKAEKVLAEMEDPEECDDSWFNYKRILYCRDKLNKGVFDERKMRSYRLAIFDDITIKNIRLESLKAMFAGEPFTLDVKYFEQQVQLDMGLIILLNDKNSVNYLLSSNLMRSDIVLIAPRFFLGSEKARQFQETARKREQRLKIDHEQRREFARHDSTEDFWKEERPHIRSHSRSSSQQQQQQQQRIFDHSDSLSWLSQTSCETRMYTTPKHKNKKKTVANSENVSTCVNILHMRHLERLCDALRSRIPPLREFDLMLELNRINAGRAGTDAGAPSIWDKIEVFGTEVTKQDQATGRAFEKTLESYMSLKRAGRFIEPDYMEVTLRHYESLVPEQEDIGEIQGNKESSEIVPSVDGEDILSFERTDYARKRLHYDNPGEAKEPDLNGNGKFKLERILPNHLLLSQEQNDVIEKLRLQNELLLKMLEKFVPQGVPEAEALRNLMRDDQVSK